MGDLLDELREWCGNVDDIVFGLDGKVTLSLLDFAAFVINREHAAAERMRERCRLAMLDAHLIAMTDDAPENVVRATGHAVDSIDELKPEEPSE